MAELTKTSEPFRFYTRLHLTELTGRRAATLKELVKLIKKAPEACIYHHTHRFLQQHQHLSPEPPNDFAYWVTTMAGEEGLGESLASIDTILFSNLRALREKIAQTIEDYLKHNPKIGKKAVPRGKEFHFLKSISFIASTNLVASDLREFIEVLKKITIDSIYFHIFEARLRLEKKTNDFSNWLENSLGEKKAAAAINRLDPYTFTLEDLRGIIIKIIEKDIPK